MTRVRRVVTRSVIETPSTTLVAAPPAATTAGGVEQMYVHVVADNVGAKAFYEDFGFHVEARGGESWTTDSVFDP